MDCLVEVIAFNGPFFKGTRAVLSLFLEDVGQVYIISVRSGRSFLSTFVVNPARP